MIRYIVTRDFPDDIVEAFKDLYPDDYLAFASYDFYETHL